MFVTLLSNEGDKATSTNQERILRNSNCGAIQSQRVLQPRKYVLKFDGSSQILPKTYFLLLSPIKKFKVFFFRKSAFTFVLLVLFAANSSASAMFYIFPRLSIIFFSINF